MPETPTKVEPSIEYFGNDPTGVEVEDTSSTEIQPWDPDRIRVHTKHFSLRQVVDMIEERDIDIAPDFQRLYVWSEKQRWSLIESILLGIPLPTFYFNEDREGAMQVVDGVQRLTTIFNFVRGEKFALGPLDYLDELRNKTFDDLDATFRRRIQNTQLIVHVIDPQTPHRVKFDIFRRINTGGSPLSAQEIRHCMSGARSRGLLLELSKSESFERATNGSLTNHIRMADREVVLRYCAFRILGLDEYDNIGSLEAFLGLATEYLDDEIKFTDAERIALTADFHRAMRNAYKLFNDRAFRKWPLGEDRYNPINRALFDIWSVLLANKDEQLVAEKEQNIVSEARRLMTNDVQFIDSISQRTGDPRKVRARFSAVQEILDETLL